MRRGRVGIIFTGCVILLAGWAIVGRDAGSTATTRAAAAATAPTGPGEYYVGGDVEQPGVYSNPGTVTLRQAIRMSRLNEPEKAEGEVVVIRNNPGGEGELIKVDLGPLMREKAGDMVLRANDTVTVRQSKGAK